MIGILSQEHKIPLLGLVGPTAVGKTSLALKVAKRLTAEIVSADSVQVYRYLDIGTAKPTLEERHAIPHHLIDVADPSVNFTVYDYQLMSQKAIADIYKRGRLPLLVGGTGFYVKAVVDGFTFSGGKSSAVVHRRLQDELAAGGKEHLYRTLEKLDPSSARAIHPNDFKRLLRALEFYYLTGEPISVQKERTMNKTSLYRPLLFGINMPREQLYQRIDKRVDLMVEQGLLAEVRGLLQKGYTKKQKALQSLGYRHIIAYLEGVWNWETALSILKRDTRRYAKRQMTWFHADQRVNWFNFNEGDNFDSILESICSQLAGY